MTSQFIYKSALWTVYQRLESNDKPCFLAAMGLFCHWLSVRSPREYVSLVGSYRARATDDTADVVSEKTKLFEFGLRNMFHEASETAISDKHGSEAFMLGVGAFIARVAGEHPEDAGTYLEEFLPLEADMPKDLQAAVK